MLETSKSVGTDMGAMDPVLARNHANNIKIKSASIEANNQPLGLSSLQYQFGFDNPEPGSSFSYSGDEQQVDRNSGRLNKQATIDTGPEAANSSFQAKAKKLLSLSPTFGGGGGGGGTGSGGGGLKPSVSTSCLLTAAQADTGSGSGNEDSNASLICLPTRASLTHEWKKLKTPNKCRECNLLVYFNGRECSFCGFVAHKKCVTILVIKCSGQTIAGLANRNRNKQLLQLNNSKSSKGKGNSASGVQPIFGQPIGNESFQVIDFIRRFIYEIDTRGLTSKGLYRVSSIKSKVDRLCNYYDQNLSSLVDLSSFHPTIIANALKMYLRQLPEPLLTHKLYNEFIELAKKYPNNNNQTNSNSQQAQEEASRGGGGGGGQQPLHRPYRRPFVLTTTTISINDNPAYDPMLIVELREIIDSLPPINRELIAIIMRHLRRVADMSFENQMSATNLSIIFGPTLLNADNKSLAIVDNIHQARCIELMITWAEQIFPQFANYESRAVIGLDLSEEYFNELRRQQDSPTYTIEQQPISGSQERKRSDINSNEKFFNFDKIPHQQQQHQQTATKTRQDLKESRRQFFKQQPPPPTSSVTSPTSVQKNNYKQQYPPPLPLPDKPITASELKPVCCSAAAACLKSTGKPLHQQVTDNSQRKSSSAFNPPGSTAVIKVQPCFCNKLSKNATDSNNKPNNNKR